MNIGKFSILCAVFSLLGGCTTAPITLNYSPSSTLSVDGEMSIGDFRYVPAEAGTVKPNQLKNTAIGNVYFDKHITEYFEKAVFTEARFVGIELDESSHTLKGNIEQFHIDDLGFSVDWTLEVRYQVLDEDQDICMDTKVPMTKTTEKFGNVFEAMDQLVRENIESLFNNSEFRNCIS